MRKRSKDGPAQPQKPESPVSDKEVAAVGSGQMQDQSSLCKAVHANVEPLRTLMNQLSLSREENPARVMEGNRSRKRRRLAITCRNCGEEGHRRSVCPKGRPTSTTIVVGKQEWAEAEDQSLTGPYSTRIVETG